MLKNIQHSAKGTCVDLSDLVVVLFLLPILCSGKKKHNDTCGKPEKGCTQNNLRFQSGRWIKDPIISFALEIGPRGD